LNSISIVKLTRQWCPLKSSCGKKRDRKSKEEMKKEREDGARNVCLEPALDALEV